MGCGFLSIDCLMPLPFPNEVKICILSVEIVTDVLSSRKVIVLWSFFTTLAFVVYSRELFLLWNNLRNGLRLRLLKVVWPRDS
jgi:hypothetical protein